MKLNCDLGESFGSWTMGLDEKVMPHIDQANIACGFHAGDPLVMQKTLALAKENNLTLKVVNLFKEWAILKAIQWKDEGTTIN